MPGEDRPSYMEEYNKSKFVGESLVGQDTVSTPEQPYPMQYTDSTPSNEEWAETAFNEDIVTTNLPEP